MTDTRELGTVCSDQSRIVMIETSRARYWWSKPTRAWLGAVFGLLVLPSYWVGRSWNRPVLGTLLCLAAIYQVVVWYVHRRSCEESAANRRSNSETVANRLEVYGDSSELAELQGLSSEVFEPYIVQFSNLWDRMPDLRIFVIPICAVVFVTARIWPGSTTIPAIAGTSVILFPVLAGMVFSCYYRISPGRLDRLVFGPFSVRARRVRTTPLTDADIVCRLDKEYVLIRQSGGVDALKIRLTNLREPREFVRKVLEGAMAKSTGAKLPDDELLG